MSIFTDRVKELMVRQNMSQKELSKITGISEASLSRYIKGTTKPRTDIIVNIAKAFDVDANTLLETTSFEMGNPEQAFKQMYSLVTRNKTSLTPEQKEKIIKALLG